MWQIHVYWSMTTGNGNVVQFHDQNGKQYKSQKLMLIFQFWSRFWKKKKCSMATIPYKSWFVYTNFEEIFPIVWIVVQHLLFNMENLQNIWILCQTIRIFMGLSMSYGSPQKVVTLRSNLQCSVLLHFVTLCTLLLSLQLQNVLHNITKVTALLGKCLPYNCNVIKCN